MKLKNSIHVILNMTSISVLYHLEPRSPAPIAHVTVLSLSVALKTSMKVDVVSGIPSKSVSGKPFRTGA